MDFQKTYRENFEALKNSKPKTAELLSNWKDQVDLQLSPAQGGGYFLALSTQNGPVAISEPAKPVQKAKAFAQKDIPGGPTFDPVLISGVRAGYELAAFFPLLHEEPGGRWQAMYVIEPSPDVFMAMMHVNDLRSLFASEHFYCFVGPDALREMQDFFLRDPMKPLPKNVSVLGRADDAQAAARTVSVCLKARAEGATQIKKTLDAYYDSIDRQTWIEDLHRKEGLRFLLISSGFSHFVQYANRDISHALKSLGHEIRIIGEKSRVDHLTGPALLRAIDEFKPHVIHHIDHMRFESAHIYPKKLIFLTSMLDYFPALENEVSAAKMGDWDYVTGYVTHWERFGYRPDRLLPQEPMSNEKIFKPVTLNPEQISKYACEVSYISNISKTPEEYLKELLTQCRSGKACRRIIEKMFEKVREEFSAGRIICEEKEYRKIFEDCGAGSVDRALGDQIVGAFFALVGNAYFRQLPLIALSEAGVDLRLYGRGWEKHPQLAKHACGVVEHGAESNLVFNASAINLHINQFRMRHNRLNDGYGAGAFFLIHRHVDELPFDTGGVLFEGCGKLPDMVRYFLKNPEIRRVNAKKNRQIVLDNYTYRNQYESMLRRLGFYFGASYFRELTEKMSETFAFYNDSPLSEMLRTRCLADIIKLTMKFDLGKAMEDYFQKDGVADDERSAFEVIVVSTMTDKMAMADFKKAGKYESKGQKDHSARYLASALFLKPHEKKWRKHFRALVGNDDALIERVSKRKLFREKTICLDRIKRPFGLTMAPDGRAAVSDWAGVKSSENRSVFLVDTKSGVVEEFAGGPGLQLGDFGADGAYYAQLYASNGVFRCDPEKREKIIETGETAQYDVIFRTVVCPDGRLLLHDWSTQRIVLHDSKGKFVREIVSPGKFKEIRGMSLFRGRLFFIGDEDLFQQSIESDSERKSLPRPPAGIWDSLTVGAFGILAVIGYFHSDAHKRKVRRIAGIASLDFDGKPNFLSYENPFVHHPVILQGIDNEPDKLLWALDCFSKELHIYHL